MQKILEFLSQSKFDPLDLSLNRCKKCFHSFLSVITLGVYQPDLIPDCLASNASFAKKVLWPQLCKETLRAHMPP